MFLYQSLFLLYPLFVQIIIFDVLSPCYSATFNAKTQFSWVDSSCDSVIDKVNDAGDDYNALVKAAIANLEGGSPSTDLGKGTLLAYFGTEVGQLINSKYGRLQSTFAAQHIPLGLYCDGSAFEWVTTYQEGPKKGEALPNSGQWHAKEGRYNPAEGPLYLSGTKTPERTNICQTPDGKNAQGVSSVGGKHIILCPDAFKEPVLGAIPTGEQTIGTSLDTLTSTGAVLLHEATHCILSTTDTTGGYKVGGVLLTAKISSNAQKNADTWMYYAMASIAAKNAWVVGLAQALDNFGPRAPKAPPSTGKRDAMPLDAHRPRAVLGEGSFGEPARPGFSILEPRAADPKTVTVTVTVTKDCRVSSDGSTGSTSLGSKAQSATNGKGSSNTASGFTTVKNNPGTTASGGGYIGPVPISAEPASLIAALESQSSVNIIGLTTFTGTKTPTPVTISSSVSSNGHSKETNGVGPFPIFWSHTCWVSVMRFDYLTTIQFADLENTVLPPRPLPHLWHSAQST